MVYGQHGHGRILLNDDAKCKDRVLILLIRDNFLYDRKPIEDQTPYQLRSSKTNIIRILTYFAIIKAPTTPGTQQGPVKKIEVPTF